VKIKNIYIRDFGIFNNQELNELAEGIVFIGGHNRAGKSSFLDIIRYLGYGLPQDGSIPPAKDEYYIQADLKNARKDYSLSINGYAKPKITSQTDENVDAADLYNNLDKFSYQQLFTISLDELQTISKIAGSSRDQKRLYSVLLGAGLSGLVRVPEIAQNYYNKAANIGGKEGRPSVYSFKPYYNEIRAAEKEKEDALKEIEQFIECKDELSRKEEQKNELLEKISNLEKEEFLLDILKNNYEEYTEIEKLKFSLTQKPNLELEKDKYEENYYSQAVSLHEELLEIEEELADFEDEIVKKCSIEEKEEFIKSYLAVKERLKEFAGRKEVLIEKIQSYLEQNEELKEKRIKLQSEAAQINSAWKNPLSEIEKIKADTLKQSEISRNLEIYRDMKSELRVNREKESDLREEYELKQHKLEGLADISSKKVLKKTYSAAAAAVVIGGATSFLDIAAGIYLSIALLLISYIYYSSNYSTQKNREAEKKSLEDDILSLGNKLKKLDSEFEEKKENLNQLEEIIDDYRSILGIRDSETLDLISDYYRMIQDKKSRLEMLKNEEKKLSEKKNEINSQLNNILELLKNIQTSDSNELFKFRDKEVDKNFLLKNYQELFIELDKAAEYLQLVENYQKLDEQLERVYGEAGDLLNKVDFKLTDDYALSLNNFIKEADILKEYIELEEDYLSRRKQLKYTLNNSSDKIRNYLLENFQKDNYNKSSEIKLNFEANSKEDEIKEKIIQSFIGLYKEYPSLEAVENKYSKISAELNKSSEQLQELEEDINSLQIKAEQLASSEKVEEAHQKINDARTNLRGLAERYAVNKSVYFILKKLRERIISRAEDELLSPAADILARITENEYQAIQTADNLEDAEFKTLLSDGSSFDSVGHLSRGTMEQLFLSVRLSRIKEIEPPLPLVIDDSLVNFDRNHLYNAADVISELGETHQIFILSCHPHFAEFLDALSDNIQYWKLDKGSFSKSSAAEVIEHLKDI